MNYATCSTGHKASTVFTSGGQVVVVDRNANRGSVCPADQSTYLLVQSFTCEPRRRCSLDARGSIGGLSWNSFVSSGERAGEGRGKNATEQSRRIVISKAGFFARLH